DGLFLAPGRAQREPAADSLDDHMVARNRLVMEDEVVVLAAPHSEGRPRTPCRYEPPSVRSREHAQHDLRRRYADAPGTGRRLRHVAVGHAASSGALDSTS